MKLFNIFIGVFIYSASVVAYDEVIPVYPSAKKLETSETKVEPDDKTPVYDSIRSEIRKSLRQTTARFANDTPIKGIAEDSDDFGLTHVMDLEHQFITATNQLYKITYSAQLYTKDLTPEGQSDLEKIPQAFNEITRLDVSTSNMYDTLIDGRMYYIVGIGIGQASNEASDSILRALKQQEVWHDALTKAIPSKTTEHYKNIEGNDTDKFVSAKYAVGKVYTFDRTMLETGAEINRLKLESGVEYISIRNGENLFILADYNKNIAKFGRVYFDIDLGTKAILHRNGVELSGLLGFSGRFKSFTFSMAYVAVTGQNEEVYDYVDNDPIFTFTFKYNY